VSSPELSVVCKSCGSEVSPYVTECPYCGARLRKRAPKLERTGEGIEAKQRRARRRRRFGRSAREALGGVRPYTTIALIAASAVMVLVQRASDRPLTDLGAFAAPVAEEPWRYLTAPFAYLDVGYLFVVGVALALFAPGLERRLGSVATLLMLVACGALGMLLADAAENATDGALFAAGGNGIALGALAAWYLLRSAEARHSIDEDVDLVGVAVAAAVLLLLPVFEDTANVFAGLGGGVVGALCGFAAARLRAAD
jgi:membrane associated rhomboid family serine protease